MALPDTSDTNIPKTALLLGLAGLIPFWALALSPLAPLGLVPVITLFMLNTYGAVILSFVGAIWWGIAVATPHAPRSAIFCWSVIPALIGWAAAAPIMPADIGLLLLFAGFALQWCADIVLVNRIALAPWFLKLRTILTLGVLGALTCAWWLLI